LADKKPFIRKHFFIDRNFQGKYMITFLIPMLVMLLFMLFTIYFASQSMINLTTRIVKDDVETLISNQLQDRPDPTVQVYQNLVNDITDYLRTFSENVKYRKAFFSTLLWIFGAGLLIVIVQLVLLTIFVSHKVAGPIYRFEKICHNLIGGNYSETVHLRKGDDMQNLAHLFNESVEKSRERLAALVNEPDAAKRKEIAESLTL
jgi:nitrate/nitrite-specific signal transduction histidine kinase